jgi:hypothetical protein
MKSSFLRAGLALLCAVLLSSCGGSNGSLILSGTVSGLSKTGLVLVNKGNGETLTVASGATTFAFTRLLAVDAAFDVEIQTQPTGASCKATANTGSATVYNVYYVVITCASNPYTLGGTVKGLSGTGLVLANGNDTVAVPAPATAGADVSFTFPTTVGDGSYYGGTVLSQPTGQTCAFSSTLNPGTMPSSNQLGLVVNCTNN